MRGLDLSVVKKPKKLNPQELGGGISITVDIEVVPFVSLHSVFANQ